MKNRDFRDLLSALHGAEARFLVVGGYAFSFHAKPRYTKDLDVWVDPSADNARKTWEALARFGAPLQGISVEDFTKAGLIYQIGVPPVRVDLLTSIDGLEFGPCWDRRSASEFDGVPVFYLSKADLIVNKKLVARPQDLVDVRMLEST